MGALRCRKQHRGRIARGGADDALGAGIERVEALAQRIAERREVGLRDHQRVGDRGLPRRLGEAGERVGPGNGIDQRHDAREAQPLVEHRVGAEREQDRAGIGQPAGLDDDAAETADVAGVAPFDQAAQRLGQILAHRAAQAAAGQLQHLTFDEIDEVMVDRDLADLVDDDGGVGKRRIASARGAAGSSCRCRETRSAA